MSGRLLVPTSVLRFSDLLGELIEFSMQSIQLRFITVNGCKANSAKGKGKVGQSPEETGHKLPAVLPSAKVLCLQSSLSVKGHFLSCCHHQTTGVIPGNTFSPPLQPTPDSSHHPLSPGPLQQSPVTGLPFCSCSSLICPPITDPPHLCSYDWSSLTLSLRQSILHTAA